MSAVRKFMFDDRFDACAQAEPPVSDGHGTESDTGARETIARANGFEAGQAAARQEASQQTADAVTDMAARLKSALDAGDYYAAQMAEDAAELAISAARLLAAPAAPLAVAARTAEVLRDVISAQLDAPRLIVRVAADTQSAVQAAADHVVADTAYAGRLDVVADAALATGDISIAWDNGGFEELRSVRLAALAEKLGEYLGQTKSDGDE